MTICVSLFLTGILHSQVVYWSNIYAKISLELLAMRPICCIPRYPTGTCDGDEGSMTMKHICYIPRSQRGTCENNWGRVEWYLVYHKYVTATLVSVWLA